MEDSSVLSAFNAQETGETYERPDGGWCRRLLDQRPPGYSAIQQIPLNEEIRKRHMRFTTRDLLNALPQTGTPGSGRDADADGAPDSLGAALADATVTSVQAAEMDREFVEKHTRGPVRIRADEVDSR